MQLVNSRTLAFCYASWFGAGFSPVAPATVGTILALPVYWLITYLAMPLQVLVLAAMILAAYKAAEIVVAVEADEDPQIVVVDEVVAILLALLLGAVQDPLSLVIGVCLFRLFDIWKPWPINIAERLTPAPLGILADDLLAGLYTGLVLLLF